MRGLPRPNGRAEGFKDFFHIAVLNVIYGYICLSKIQWIR